MGQTLPNDIYLPAEGERNCYDGLEGNWRALDSLISTVAGKASATHTHGNITNDGKVGTTANLPLITGTSGTITTGSFGTSANTFCEGNDSRLSDARTPVAHTHTKSDVTDLLNSNFIPSANNSYDLGSSSYQWNNLYAKNYYYNGTAWGLDKDNAWTNFNRFNGYRLHIKNSSQEIGVLPTSNQWNGFSFTDKNNNQTVSFEHALMGSGETRFKISMVDNVASHDSGSTVWIEFLRLTAYSGGSGFGIGANANPLINNSYSLGTSTAKWKTLNGINPGALSLPSGGTTENTDWFNVAGDILPTGGNATAFSRATANYFIPAKDGWLALAVKNCSELSVWCDTLKYGISIVAPDASVNRQTVIPVVAGKSYQILITGNSWISARLIMPQGNV